MYEITWLETGRVKEMSYDEAVKMFGEDEFHEILDGFLPHIVAVNLDYDLNEDELAEGYAEAHALAMAEMGADDGYLTAGEDTGSW